MNKIVRLFFPSQHPPAHIYWCGYILSSVILLCMCGLFTLSRNFRTPTPEWTPWQSVGGCGVGGSGGGSGAKATWIGKGVPGAIFELEAMYTQSTGQNFISKTLNSRVAYNPTYEDQIGITLPYVYNIGPLQPRTNLAEEAGHVTGGIGDVAFDYSRLFGMNGEYSLSLGLSIPTGQYDIKRGSDERKWYLPQNLQKGSGVYNPNIGLSYTKDLEEGLIMINGSYTHPVTLSFSGKNTKFYLPDKYPDSLYKWSANSKSNKKRFDYFFKPYGENDLGAYSPPSFSFSAYWAYRGMKHYLHSLGLTFSFPLAVAWIPGFEADSYDPRPDPDHQAWSGSINYGVEYTSDADIPPLFFALSLPIHDQRQNDSGTSKSHWDMPDWNDFLQQLKINAGFKIALY